jgi:hypothetical protein
MADIGTSGCPGHLCPHPAAMLELLIGPHGVVQVDCSAIISADAGRGVAGGALARRGAGHVPAGAGTNTSGAGARYPSDA